MSPSRRTAVIVTGTAMLNLVVRSVQPRTAALHGHVEVQCRVLEAVVAPGASGSA